MTDPATYAPIPSATQTVPAALRIADSALVPRRSEAEVAAVRSWLGRPDQANRMDVRVVDLDDLAEWRSDPESGTIRHRSGRFFTVEGLEIVVPDNPVPRWSQPIMNQPETGILGLLLTEFDGVLHCLVQAKAEPGNYNGRQISPTVQATRSNYTGVHRGRPVPYLDYFRHATRHRVLADVRQSEQGSWFYQKRNRNMIVEVAEAIEPLPGFCWLTIGQLHQLLAVDDLVNMDTRTVLSCLPFAGPGLPARFAGEGDPFSTAVVRSCSPAEGSRHGTAEILSWITDIRSRADVRAERVPLRDLPGWHRADGRITHRSGLFFDVIGVRVRAGDREVDHWSQPMFRAHGIGLIAFLVTRMEGVLHVLAHARVEPGYVDVIELAPTVQCTPENYDYLPARARPRFLDEVLHAPAERIRFDATLSEEGGRFYHTRNRYLVVETDRHAEEPGFRWLTLHQFADLLRHSHYVNVQARTLLACLHSLSRPGRPKGVPS